MSYYYLSRAIKLAQVAARRFERGHWLHSALGAASKAVRPTCAMHRRRAGRTESGSIKLIGSTIEQQTNDEPLRSGVD